ncbi:MAG TPA: hypothetical protein VJW95_02525 [Dissulfurispiraceae bacterium]|nr:hypothetical protein [Dissulfurispiraceae bacterium]
MEKLDEFVDSWVKSQEEFMENWVKSQKEFMENWTESIKKMQESFVNMGGSKEGPTKEILSLYNSWLTTMMGSSKAFTVEAEKIQETWKNTIENQMAMSREMMKNFSEFFKQADKK